VSLKDIYSDGNKVEFMDFVHERISGKGCRWIVLKVQFTTTFIRELSNKGDKRNCKGISQAPKSTDAIQADAVDECCE